MGSPFAKLGKPAMFKSVKAIIYYVTVSRPLDCDCTCPGQNENRIPAKSKFQKRESGLDFHRWKVLFRQRTSSKAWVSKASLIKFALLCLMQCYQLSSKILYFRLNSVLKVCYKECVACKMLQRICLSGLIFSQV